MGSNIKFFTRNISGWGFVINTLKLRKIWGVYKFYDALGSISNFYFQIQRDGYRLGYKLPISAPIDTSSVQILILAALAIAPITRKQILNLAAVLVAANPPSPSTQTYD